MSCSACFKGSVHGHATPKGTMETVYGVETYIGGLPSERRLPSTIILLTDVFNLKLVNNKLLADYFTENTGFRVLVPNVVPGGGVPLSALTAMEGFTVQRRWYDVFGHISTFVSAIRILPYFFPILWGARQASATILAYARALKAEMPSTAKIGAAGYCWGGKETLILAREPVYEGSEEPLLTAQYVAHPSSLKLPDDILESITAFGVPFSLAVAEVDFCVDKPKALEVEARIQTQLGGGNDRGQYTYNIQIYDGVQHGFACRANRMKTWEDECANKAALQAVEFFKRWLS